MMELPTLINCKSGAIFNKKNKAPKTIFLLLRHLKYIQTNKPITKNGAI